MDNATIVFDPENPPLKIGGNLILGENIAYKLPRKLPSVFTSVMEVSGKIIGDLPEKLDNAFVQNIGGVISVKHRPRATLFLVR